MKRSRQIHAEPFIKRHEKEILIFIATIFLVLSIYHSYADNLWASAVFAAFLTVFIVLAFVGGIEYLKIFGTTEMKLHQAEKIVHEATELGKLVAEIAIPLAHHSTGWADTAPATTKMKNLVISKSFEMSKKFEFDIDENIIDLNYYKTCSDYVLAILHLRTESGEMSKIFKKMTKNNIPISIDDVETPDSFQNIFVELDSITDNISMYIDDYRYYFNNKRHRDEARWLDRANWSKD